MVWECWDLVLDYSGHNYAKLMWWILDSCCRLIFVGYWWEAIISGF